MMQRMMREPAPDEVSFVHGFVACFGIITGQVDIGLDQDAPLDRILDNIHEDIVDFQHRWVADQRMQKAVRDMINGWEDR